MLGIEAGDAHTDATARFVAGLRIDELLVMRVVHPHRDEGGLMAQTAALDEHFHHIAAIEHELAERVRLLPVALLDPCIVLIERQHLARPHRHHTKTGLQEVRIHACASQFINRGLQHLLPKRLPLRVEGADAGGDVGDVVAVEQTKWSLAQRHLGTT